MDGQSMDDREGDKLPLEARMQGAKAMLGKTRETNLAGWQSLNIHAKRDAMYTQLGQEQNDSSVRLLHELLHLLWAGADSGPVCVCCFVRAVTGCVADCETEQHICEAGVE